MKNSVKNVASLASLPLGVYAVMTITKKLFRKHKFRVSDEIQRRCQLQCLNNEADGQTDDGNSKESDPLVVGKVTSRSMSTSKKVDYKVPSSNPPGEKESTEYQSKEVLNLENEIKGLKNRIRELEEVNKNHITVVFNIIEESFVSKQKADSFKESRSQSVEQNSIPEAVTNNSSVQEFRDQFVDRDHHELDILRSCLEEKETEIKDQHFELQSIKEEFLRFRKQSESNVKEYEQKMETLTDQLIHLKSGRHLHSRTFLDPFPENESTLIGASSSLAGTSICDESYSIDVEHSTGHDSSMDDNEEHCKKIYHLTQSLRSMGAVQKDLQRRLVDAQEEKDHFKSVVFELQQQVDASSPETCTQLRAIAQTMESDINRLELENRKLTQRIHAHHVEISDNSEDEEDDVTELESEVGPELQPIDFQETEELMDCSFDIMGEMANAASETELGISLSYVQYAGLLAAIQKAIKQLDESKVSSEASTKSFRALDRSLSSTLSVSSVRVRGPQGEGRKRLDHLFALMKEKESGLKFMKDMLNELHQEIKGQQSLSVQQEVQLEYLRQQLGNPEKVIRLTWEVESLKKAADENQRELKALKDLQDQQQRELTIQWQSKQKAVAEKLSQHHTVSSYSQQLEHVIEANEALQAEKIELEEALQEAKHEAEGVKEKLLSKITTLKQDLETEKQQPRGLLSRKDCELLLNNFDKTKVFVNNSQILSNEIMRLLGALRDIQKHCVEWQKEMESEKQKFIIEKEALLGKIKLTENAKLRAEQEKTGLQEILSLTSEATSQEIMNLQAQVKKLTEALNEKTESLESAFLKISEKETAFQEVQQIFQEKEFDRISQMKDLKDKLQIAILERSDLEEHVKNYKRAMTELNKNMNTYDTKLKESAKTEEAQMISLKLEQEKVTVFRTTVGELTEEISELKAKCNRFKEIEDTMRILEKVKQDLEKENQTLKAVTKTQEQEISYLQNEMTELKEKALEGTKQRLNLQEQLAELRQQLAEEYSNWEAEFAKIGDLSIPRDQWPQPVTILVEHCEAEAMDKCQREADSKSEKMRSLLQKSEERVKAAEEEGISKLQESDKNNWNLEEKIEKLQNEMKCRELRLKQEILNLKESSEQKINELLEELDEVKDQYQSLESENDDSMNKLRMQLEDKSQQITAIQEKARELMKEKEKEITQLKQSTGIFEIIPEKLEEDNSNPHDQTPEQVLIQKLKNQITELVKSLADSEHTHELRDRACQVLKEELQEHQRSKKRENLDIEYLKNVLVNAFEKDTLPKTSPMVDVLARLLHFSPEEMARIHEDIIPNAPRSVSTSSSILSGWLRQ